MKSNRLATTVITPAHRKWITAEEKKTGNPISVIIRRLLQEKVDEAKGK